MSEHPSGYGGDDLVVREEGDSRAYFAQIPNIIFDLGLSPFELSLYCHLKRIAGSAGKCWKGVRAIAKGAEMSVGQVTDCKKSLQARRTELSGKPLILVSVEERKNCGKIHIIRIVDIWADNFKRYGGDPVHTVNTPCSSPEHPVHGMNERRYKEEEPPLLPLTPAPPGASASPPLRVGKKNQESCEDQAANEDVFPAVLNTAKFHEAWDEWLKYRTERRLPKLTATSTKRQWKQLAEWGVEKSIQSIEDAIRNQWQGLFEPKPTRTNGSSSHHTKSTDYESRTYDDKW